MRFLKIPQITKDRTLRRLRWLMVCVILVDTINTLLGQPASYAEDPSTAQELNKFMRIFVHMGAFLFIGSSLVYIAACFALVSVLPRRIAYALMFAVVFGHFFGASTWMVYYQELGVQAAVIYGSVIAIGFVLCGLPQHAIHAPKSGNSRELEAEQAVDGQAAATVEPNP